MRWSRVSILQIDTSICNCEDGRFAMCEPTEIQHNIPYAHRENGLRAFLAGNR